MTNLTPSQKTKCGITNNIPPNPTPLWKMITKEQLLDDIISYGGCVSFIVRKYSVTYKQVYKAIDHYNLREDLYNAKETFLDKAKSVIFDALDSENEAIALKAAETTLKYNQPQNQQQITLSSNNQTLTIQQIFGF